MLQHTGEMASALPGAGNVRNAGVGAATSPCCAAWWREGDVDVDVALYLATCMARDIPRTVTVCRVGIGAVSMSRVTVFMSRVAVFMSCFAVTCCCAFLMCIGVCSTHKAGVSGLVCGLYICNAMYLLYICTGYVMYICTLYICTLYICTCYVPVVYIYRPCTYCISVHGTCH